MIAYSPEGNVLTRAITDFSYVTSVTTASTPCIIIIMLHPICLIAHGSRSDLTICLIEEDELLRIVSGTISVKSCPWWEWPFADSRSSRSPDSLVRFLAQS